MKTTSIKIPSELFALAESSRFEGEWALESLSVGPDDYVFEKPLSWWVDVTNTGEALLVEGRASATGLVACSRCLEEVAYDFDAAIEGYFLMAGVEAIDSESMDEELGDDEFDVLPDDHIIDLEPLIRAALVVDAANMPLCREDCKGLCPVCGSNLNEGACGCGRDEALEEFDREANPFSALAHFHFE